MQGNHLEPPDRKGRGDAREDPGACARRGQTDTKEC